MQVPAGRWGHQARADEVLRPASADALRHGRAGTPLVDRMPLEQLVVVLLRCERGWSLQARWLRLLQRCIQHATAELLRGGGFPLRPVLWLRQVREHLLARLRRDAILVREAELAAWVLGCRDRRRALVHHHHPTRMLLILRLSARWEAARSVPLLEEDLVLVRIRLLLLPVHHHGGLADLRALDILSLEHLRRRHLRVPLQQGNIRFVGLRRRGLGPLPPSSVELLRVSRHILVYLRLGELVLPGAALQYDRLLDRLRCPVAIAALATQHGAGHVLNEHLLACRALHEVASVRHRAFLVRWL